jgi:hypothetical protein
MWICPQKSNIFSLICFLNPCTTEEARIITLILIAILRIAIRIIILEKSPAFGGDRRNRAAMYLSMDIE